MLIQTVIWAFRLLALLHLGIGWRAFQHPHTIYSLVLMIINLLLGVYLAWSCAEVVGEIRGGLEALLIYSPGWLFNLLFHAAWWGLLGSLGQHPISLSVLLLLSLVGAGISFWASAIGGAY